MDAFRELGAGDLETRHVEDLMRGEVMRGRGRHLLSIGPLFEAD